MIVKRFEDLECWQEARNLVNLAYDVTKKEVFGGDLALVGRVRQSAMAAMADIADGYQRRNAEAFVRFLRDASGAVAELQSLCYVALDQGYVEQEEMDALSAQSYLVLEKINKLISRLERLSLRSANKRKTGDVQLLDSSRIIH